MNHRLHSYNFIASTYHFYSSLIVLQGALCTFVLAINIKFLVFGMAKVLRGQFAGNLRSEVDLVRTSKSSLI